MHTFFRIHYVNSSNDVLESRDSVAFDNGFINDGKYGIINNKIMGME